MASFASLAQRSGFRSLGISSTDDKGGLQPLPVSSGRGAQRFDPRLRSITGPQNEPEEVAPQGPPPPSPEEIHAAESERDAAQRELQAAKAEIARLQAEIEGERRGHAQLAEALDRAWAGAQHEMRAAYAELVLEGSRRLIGSLTEHDAVFHARLDTVSEQLVLETDVVLEVAPRNKRIAEQAVFGRMGWSVEVNPSMDDGCIARCRNSTIDARLETAFESMAQELQAWLAEDGAGGTTP